MIEVNFKKLHPNASIPEKATELAGGWDVKVTEIIEKDKDFVICKLGFALGIQEGYKLTLVPRSSLTKTKWILQNSPGLGDADYTGEYQFRFRAIPYDVESKHDDYYSNDITGYELLYDTFPYKIGDRIGQVYLEEVLPIKFNIVDDLKNTERGDGGYGSTGNK